MWWPDGVFLAAVTLVCAFVSVSTPPTLAFAFVAGLFIGMAIERRSIHARQDTIELCIERVKAGTERCHWEIALLRRAQDVSPVLGTMQDTAATARAVDEAVSCDHDSEPASLHSSEMRSMMPTIANDEWS